MLYTTGTKTSPLFEGFLGVISAISSTGTHDVRTVATGGSALSPLVESSRIASQNCFAVPMSSSFDPKS